MILVDCAKELNLNKGNLNSCLSGKRPQTKGYIFEDCQKV